MIATRSVSESEVRHKLLDGLLAGYRDSDFTIGLVKRTGLTRGQLETAFRAAIGGGFEALALQPELNAGRMPARYFVEQPAGVPVTDVYIERSGARSAARNIRYGIAQSWFGECFIAASEWGICQLDLGPNDQGFAELQETFPQANLTLDEKFAGQLAQAIFAENPGRVTAHLHGTEFQIRVWEALMRVPAGACMSYGKLAASIGSPSAARAVGSAVGQNRIALLVPCHRVLPVGGAPGAFRWGTARKWALLLREHLGLPHSLTTAA